MISRIFDIPTHIKKISPQMPNTFSYKENGKWRDYSIDDYINKSENCALGLIELGLMPGDKVITITKNRPEWNFLDIGIISAGLIHTPIYPNINDDEYSYILEHSEAKVLVCETEDLYKRLKPIAEKQKTIKRIYVLNKVKNVEHWSALIELGKKAREKGLLTELKKRKDAVKPDDLVSIIYTSGTTGRPKGVMLSHRNFIFQVPIIGSLIPLKAGDKSLSFLPLCHVLERIGNYSFQYLGLNISYVESIEKIADNMREVKPHIFVTVPRLMERLYDKILARGKSLTGLKKTLFFAAVNHGLKYTNEKSSLPYKIMLQIYRKLIFSKWKEAMGGNLTLIIAGGAALQPRLARIFHAAEMRIYEGYGLTETAPVISVNRPGELKFTTTGPALSPEQEIKIADDGEILFKGPNLMLGYYKAPELTKEVLDEEGRLHTGDIGEMVDGKFLRITDRKKEMFKLSTGKYVAPQVIENICKESLFIEQIMVTGENKKYTAALISPNFDFLHNWASRKNINFKTNKELVEKPRVIARYEKEIDKYNQRLSRHEQIKKFLLVSNEWSTETGELSPTLKLKRRHIRQKYHDKCSMLYPNDKI